MTFCQYINQQALSSCHFSHSCPFVSPLLTPSCVQDSPQKALKNVSQNSAPRRWKSSALKFVKSGDGAIIDDARSWACPNIRISRWNCPGMQQGASQSEKRSSLVKIWQMRGVVKLRFLVWNFSHFLWYPYSYYVMQIWCISQTLYIHFSTICQFPFLKRYQLLQEYLNVAKKNITRKPKKNWMLSVYDSCTSSH